MARSTSGSGWTLIVLNAHRYNNNYPLAAKVFMNRLEQLEFLHRTSTTGSHYVSRPGYVLYFPGCEPGASGSPEGRAPRSGERPVCPTCFTTLPTTGICGYCAD